MKIWLNQWAVGVKGEVKYIFTSTGGDLLEAIAIAKEMFGAIEWIQDEDEIRVDLTDAEIDGTPHRTPGVAA